jgi:hypothetical protein
VSFIINYNQTLNCSNEEVIALLNDFKGYNKWWPKKFKISHSFKNNTNYLTFYPLFGFKIIWEIISTNKSIKTSYNKGPITGNGKWIIEQVSTNKTNLHYNIKVTPRNLFFELLFIKSLFKKVHIYHMKHLFNELEKHLTSLT